MISKHLFYSLHIDFNNHSVVPGPFILFKEKADTLVKLEGWYSISCSPIGLFCDFANSHSHFVL